MSIFGGWASKSKDQAEQEQFERRVKYKASQLWTYLGSLSNNEVDYFREQYEYVSRGEDSLDLENFSQLVRACGFNPTERQLDDVLLKGDFDNDGTITFREFCYMLAVLKDREMTESDVKQAFKTLDADKNGRISVKELQKMLRDYGDAPLEGYEMEDFRKTFDLERDGTIDYRQFHSICTKLQKKVKEESEISAYDRIQFQRVVTCEELDMNAHDRFSLTYDRKPEMTYENYLAYMDSKLQRYRKSPDGALAMVPETYGHRRDGKKSSALSIDDLPEQTYAMIKPDAVKQRDHGKIIRRIEDEGFNIAEQKEMTMTKDMAKEFYKEHKGKAFYNSLVKFMTSGPVVALRLEKPNAIKAWRKLAGPTNSNKAREEDPTSIRALYGTDGSQNAVHGSDSRPSAARELALVFSDDDRGRSEKTYAMIKPDAVRNGHVDAILKRIKEEGFRVLVKQYTEIPKKLAMQFYAEHDGKPFFDGLISFMTSGPVCTLMLEKRNAIKDWRALMGPTNTEKARKEQPNSLRGLYGTDGTQNATHGSDSVESANRELELIFEFEQAN